MHVQSVLTPEQESFLNSTEIDIKLPRTPEGRILADMGYDSEALRFERCEKVMFRRCKNHHVDRRLRMRCGLPFCISCTANADRKRLETWEPLLKAISSDNWRIADHHGTEVKRFTYVDFNPPTGKDKDSTEEWLAHLKSTLMSAKHVPYWTFFAGYTQDGKAIVRLLILTDEIPHEWWEEKFPHTCPQVHIVPIYRIHYFFKTCLNVSHIPTDPRDKAEQFVQLKGVHRLRVHGISPDGTMRCEGEYFSVGAFDSTEKCDEGGTADKSKKHKCLECGCPLEFASRDYLDEFVPLQTINWERNTDLPAPESPG